MCDATHNNSFGSGVTAINKVCKRIVYMNYDIIVFFYQWLYSQISLTYTWGLKQISVYVIYIVYLIVL